MPEVPSSPRLAKLIQRLQSFISAEGILKGLNFQPAPDDVIINTPEKCGTTWMQQIAHGLRSNGSMEFEEIGSVVPFIEFAFDYGYLDLNKDQGYVPRMYKTHAWYPFCPKNAGKYIFVIRNPIDASISHYKFFNGWFFKKDEISIDDFIVELLCQRGVPPSKMQFASIWHHLNSWYPHRHDANVLWMHFEDMLEDLPQCIDMIAEFLGIGADDDDLKKLVALQSSKEFMTLHVSKFDDHVLKQHRNEKCGLPKDAGLTNPKVMANNGTEYLPAPSTIEALNQKWRSIVEPITGYDSYKSFRQGVNRELGRGFGTGK